MRREVHDVGFRFHIDACRIVLADDVKRPDMQDDDARQHERQQIMQRKEAVEGRIVDREAAEQQLLDPVADQRDGGEEAGDDGGAPERHLPPGQHIAHERRRHHQQKVGAAENPQQFARRLVGAVIEAAADVDVDRDEEERSAVRMQVAQQPAGIHVAHDLVDRIEGQRRVGRIVHGQHDAGHDLRRQHHREDAAERIGVVQVARDRIDDELIMHHARQRQAGVEPASDPVLGA